MLLKRSEAAGKVIRTSSFNWQQQREWWQVEQNW